MFGDVFGDPRLAEAVRLGIDRTELVREVLLDLAEPGDDLFGPGLAYHPTGFAPVERDVARARELVAAAGADRLEVPLLFDPFDPMSRPAADTVVEQLAEIGLTCTPREPDPPDAVPTPGIRFRRAAATPLPLYLRAAAASADDAPPVATAGGDDAPAAAGRADVRALLATARGVPDEAHRVEALRRAQLLLRDRSTVWSSGDEHVGVSADLTGVEPARPDTATWARFHRLRMG